MVNKSVNLPNDFGKIKMGGFGSGRKFGANVTDDYRQIDIRRWQRDGLLFPGSHINWQWSRNGEKIASIGAKVETGYLRLIYDYRAPGSESWEPLDYPVRLQTTPCHYGGVRYWFTCPAVGCGRRVAILYSGGKYYACRHCYQLAYQSQREDKGDRGHRGANKIRAKLGWAVGIANPLGGKPKGMHWRTYNRMMLKQLRYANDANRGMIATLKRLDVKFAELEELLNC
ncbi:hypothetical protein [Methylomonas sp. HYX-M1]|uniref:hypothetical protein n=1 Tax=Methylomonas sp. HYX-M1 TaxID=3139307 RepID=UPI00345B98B0